MDASWTITQATDWPMAVQMITWAAAIFVVVFGGCFSIIIGLGVYCWNDLKKRISSQRREDHENQAEHCKGCKSELEDKITEHWAPCGCGG